MSRLRTSSTRLTRVSEDDAALCGDNPIGDGACWMNVVGDGPPWPIMASALIRLASTAAATGSLPAHGPDPRSYDIGPGPLRYGGEGAC